MSFSGYIFLVEDFLEILMKIFVEIFVKSFVEIFVKIRTRIIEFRLMSAGKWTQVHQKNGVQDNMSKERGKHG